VNGAAGRNAVGQRIDVRAQLPGVHGHPLCPHRLLGGLYRLDVAGERDLRVDDHLAPVGEGDDQIGPDTGAGVVGAGGLLDEVAVLDQAGDLHDAAQLHLAPTPAHVRRAQRGDQRRGLVLELGRGLPDGAHLLAQLTVGGGAGALHAGQQPVQVVQRLVHRVEPGLLGPAPGQQRDHAEGGGGGEQGTEEETGEQGSGVHAPEGAGRY
jgi:hypothetical protein